MSHPTLLFMTCLLAAGILLPAQTPGMSAAVVSESQSALPVVTGSPLDASQWINWGANQYGLADDGAFIWIGGAGGILRWDKQQHSYLRYSGLDGLPHTVVLAAAVDGAGNRWFGGDGGLSRLDAEESWTHFNADNSGLYSDLVDGIAVVGGDTLYVSHGLPGGSVSRRDGDGTWRWYPNRETALQADYATIVQTHGSNPLWTVAGTEVWAGSRVFDGERWQERSGPFPTGEPTALAVDSSNHVWALSVWTDVYEWDGAGWTAHPVDMVLDGELTALAVDREDRVWIGLQDSRTPYGTYVVKVRQLANAEGGDLAVAGPMAALLPTLEGVWAMGPGWLMLPDTTIAVPDDAPRFEDVADALVGADGAIWLYSGVGDAYTLGAVQTLDDRGTLALQDDAWQVEPTDYRPDLGYCEGVTAFERALGDTWYASTCKTRFPLGSKAVRMGGRERIEYPLPLKSDQQVTDIYAQDSHHVWFAAWDGVTGNVLGLDDGGTPAEPGDDVWRTFPIGVVQGMPVVAVDALGHLWVGQSSGLYRYNGSSWQLIYGDRPICDLAPAGDGTLYAQLAPWQATGCEERSDEVLVVRADGMIEHPTTSKALIESEPGRVRTAWRPNNLWTIASDGAIWYVSRDDPGQELQRRSSSGLTTFALPVPMQAVQRMEVDAHGHVWLVADSQLWRMAGPRPTYRYLPIASR
jgi:hypothetical protein